MVNILREGRKIEAIATVPGIVLPVVGVGFLPTLFGAGIGGLAIPLEILLQTCIPLGAEAPGKTLCIAQARENMGAKGNQEQKSTEWGTNHNSQECKSGNRINATLEIHQWFDFEEKSKIVGKCYLARSEK
jgi:hypothetical protein